MARSRSKGKGKGKGGSLKKFAVMGSLALVVVGVWRYLPAGIVSLWVLSSLAAFEPARRAASVPPAVATRSV